MPKPSVEKPTPEHAQPLVDVVQVADDLILVDKRRYQVVLTHKQPFDRAAFAMRYTEILEKYDYIVGDWGYEQLRLKGFYAPDNRHANKGQTIATLDDYLTEYCNFGCAYFVLQRLDAPAPKPKRRPQKPTGTSNNRRRRSRRGGNKPYTERTTAANAAPTAGHAQTVANNKPHKRHFTIRQNDSQ